MEASALHAPVALRRPAGGVRLMRLRSDDQLVALFRMGYDEAFSVIHDRYRQRLFAYTRQMLSSSRSDAEDALQDTFIRAYGALRADDRPVTLRAWLYRVAHNRCIDQLRRAPAPMADLFDAGRAPLSDPSAECERREDLRRLVRDVARLPDQQRSALLMRELEGLTYQEIAAAMSVSVPAVKSLLVRARMGLADANDARDAACVEIRADLAGSQQRGVRASGRARRHLHECGACREFRDSLRTAQRGLAALSPGSGPMSGLAKLLGLGAGGSGAAAGGGAAIGGGAATVTATKVAALVCCAALAGSAAEVQQIASAPAAHHKPRAHARAVAHNAAPPTAKLVDPALLAAAPAPSTERAATVVAAPTAPGPPADPAGDPATTPADGVGATDPQTGGTLAPDEPADPAAAAPPAAGTTADNGAGTDATASGGSDTQATPPPSSSGTGGPSGQLAGSGSGGPTAQGASAGG
jgi:RNA polymerase sigma factor (sigma-70 family)